MRFAAIADVHGNYLALEAVLVDIRAQGIGEIVHLGDMASGSLDAHIRARACRAARHPRSETVSFGTIRALLAAKELLIGSPALESIA